MEDRIYEYDSDIKGMENKILEMTKECDTNEMRKIFENVKDILHLAIMEMHNCQM